MAEKGPENSQPGKRKQPGVRNILDYYWKPMNGEDYVVN
jgi:hypothetical protein